MGRTALLREHTELGDTAVGAAVAVAVLAVVVAGAAVHDIYLIGDSGAKASWSDTVSSTRTQDGPGRPAGS